MGTTIVTAITMATINLYRDIEAHTPFQVGEILWRFWDKRDYYLFLGFYFLSVYGCKHNNVWWLELGTIGLVVTYIRNRSGN